MIEIEEREIPGFPGYMAQSTGHIVSYKKSFPIVMAERYDKDGYLVVGILDKSGKQKKCLVHRLIALAFIDNPDNLPEVNHKNRQRDCNNVENLEWITRKDNAQNRKYPSKLKKHPKVGKYDLDGNLIAVFDTYMAGARTLDNNAKIEHKCAKITMCCQGLKKTYQGFCWKYINE